MAVTVTVKKFQVPKSKTDKVLKVEFRGVSHLAKIVEEDGIETIEVNKTFEWPVARAVEDDELLMIELYTRNRLFSDKLIGFYKLVLQHVAKDGKLSVSDNLLDENNQILPATVEFDVSYTPPDESMLTYEALQDDQQMLIDIEQNIANIERNMAANARESTVAGSGEKQQKSSFTERTLLDKKKATLRAVRNLVRFGKQRPPKDSDNEEEITNLLNESRRNSQASDGEPNFLSGLGSPMSMSSNEGETSTNALTEREKKSSRMKTDFKSAVAAMLKSQHFQVCLTIIEARQLAGINMDPIVCIQVGDQKKYTSVKESTNCPYYNEYFVFDFHMPPIMLFDKIITLSVLQARHFLRGKKLLGSFKFDVGTVWSEPAPLFLPPYTNQRQVNSLRRFRGCRKCPCPAYKFPYPAYRLVISASAAFNRLATWLIERYSYYRKIIETYDHQFYHKWALLTDPDDIAGGPKGYLKCDISVIGKGDSVKVPPKSEKDEDDIEANLLLPDGVPTDRQKARIIVKIYRADGLPKMNSSIMANVKKAFTGELNDLVDPYVQVSFAGLMGKTSVIKHSYAPVWNEQLIFTEMFPPLCQRIKIQLRADDPVKPTVIGTHFIDLKTISNDGEKGFLPTFGPSFIHLYGSTRDYSLIDEHSSLNTGLGEGVSYRARLLVSIRTEITDSVDLSQVAVEIEPVVPVNEVSYAKNEEFFLFATILDASILEKKLGDKSVYFEISIGNAGNAMDGHNQSAREHYDSDSDELEVVTTDSASWQSTTSPTKPMTHDKTFYFLPYWDNKPCMHIRSVWPDHRGRMYNSNTITKLTEKFEDGLSEVTSAVEAEDPNVESQLKQVLECLSTSCAKYITLSKAAMAGPGTGKTKLDKEHMKLCQREIEQIGNAARNLKALVTKSSFKERLKSAQKCLGRLKLLVEDPQHALPDVFLWIISRGKRQAYQRIPARDIIYSPIEEECGKDCGKVQTMFLKLPGKKAMGPSGWSIPAKLQIFLWLGLLKHKKTFLTGLPGGYEHTQEIKNIERPRALPPNTIHYVEKHLFQLRAHIYQARSLIGSDASGLSDPFARILAGEFSKTTQVIDETLSPTWDELLIFDEILIYGDGDEIKNDPPPIIVEIFDQDKVGKSEFIGRTLAKPNVKLKDDAYSKPKFPPSLEWFTITRGADAKAGELLAAFELLEIPNDTEGSLPSLPHAKDIPIYHETDPKRVGTILPVPRGIRPTLARYRIEVLFWGLRDLKRVHFLTVDKPRIDIECSGNILYSSVIQNRKKNPNFSTLVKFLDMDLPEQELYRPPVTIRAVDCRSFGRYTLVGTHIINSIHKYIYKPTTKKDREIEEKKKLLNQLKPVDMNVQINQTSPTNIANPPRDKEKSPLIPKDTSAQIGYGTQEVTKKMKTEINKKRKQSFDEELDDEEDSKDWWTKYFASKDRASEVDEVKQILYGNLPIRQDDNNAQSETGADKGAGQQDNKKRFTLKSVATASRFAVKINPKLAEKPSRRKTAQCKVFSTELENRPEFNEFKDWLHTFALYRGKKTAGDSEDDSRIVGYFKGAIKVYKWPLPKDVEDKTSMGFDPHLGLFQGLPSNDPIKVLVRIYIVKAIDLHPMDLNGKADPYILLQLGSKKISDKDNYVSKQLNPVFGKCFEIEATFPQDSVLTVQIYDWDLVSSDDMIGETKIDLENRFYSRHRASCGLAEVYEEEGYNAWRDAMKPTQILSKLCKDSKVESPIYGDGMVKIGKQIFFVETNTTGVVSAKEREEHMALAVLHRWHEFPKIGCHLVPEHVETRPIYNPDKPGIEQGKIEMWVDMFTMDMPLPASKLDISPRKPKSYELRVVIWNTDEVVLEDDAFFTGEKMSDIYVKGWLKGQEDCQCTDIHYRSLTGEGNFNWRFIYPFDYLVAEQKIVITKKESLFSWDETESKIPARLELQVFDADHFSADDFLGAITLDLNRFPRGAKSSKLCTLDMLKTDGSVPMINIFKQKRVKGWWPFSVKKDNEEMELTGKVEAEIHLLSSEEAEKSPAGLARSEPDALDKPNRPDSSFIWFMNPLKSLRYILWHNYKYTILKLFIITALAFIILLFFYSVPGYTVKKIIGA